MSSQVSRTWASVSRTGICHSSFTSHKQKYLWVCSLIHSRIIFFAVQILLIVLSFVTFGYASFIPVKSVNEKGCWIVLAYISLIGSIAGILALRLSDKIHQIGCRIMKHCAIPPFLIIIPSFIVQICYAVLLANLTFLYLSKRFASINEQPILILIFGEVIPILLVWLMIFYVFMAELDCFRYIIHCSRNWRLPKYNPAVLNVKDSNFESLLESSSRKHFNVMDALQELERTKSSLSGGTYDSDSKQSFTDAEIKSEAISSKYGTRNASHFSHFSSYARKGYSATGFHLETVPEESPKSSTSLP